MNRTPLRKGKRYSGSLVGGRQPLTNVEYFSPNDSNTIDDLSGFKTKFSKVRRTWDGWYTTDENWYYRNPQDFPVIAQRQKIYPNARSEQFFPPEPTGTDYSSDYAVPEYSAKFEII